MEKSSSGSYWHSFCSVLALLLQQDMLTHYLPQEQTMLLNFTAKTTVGSNPKMH